MELDTEQAMGDFNPVRLDGNEGIGESRQSCPSHVQAPNWKRPEPAIESPSVVSLTGLYNEWETAPLTLPLPQGERSRYSEACLEDFPLPSGGED